MAKKKYKYLYQELKDIANEKGYDFFVTEELKIKNPGILEVVVGGRITNSFQDFLLFNQLNSELSYEHQYAKYFTIDDDVGKLIVVAIQTVAKHFQEELQVGNVVLLKGTPMYPNITSQKIVPTEVTVAIHSVYLVHSAIPLKTKII
jgi:hypothetical protein